jgi:hypothetical protein
MRYVMSPSISPRKTPHNETIVFLSASIVVFWVDCPWWNHIIAFDRSIAGEGRDFVQNSIFIESHFGSVCRIVV